MVFKYQILERSQKIVIENHRFSNIKFWNEAKKL